MSKTTPKDLAKKRNDEKLLISEMIALYCRKQHHTLRGSLCRSASSSMIMRWPALSTAPLWRPRPFARPARCIAISRRCGKRSALSCVGRAQNAAGASRSLHQACDRDNEGKA